jgi:hypothetical protein
MSLRVPGYVSAPKAYAPRQQSLNFTLPPPQQPNANMAPSTPQVYHLPYYEACVRDACGCDTGGDCECLCDAVAAYAKACLDKGVCVDWRTPDFCRECLTPCPKLFHLGNYPRSLSRQEPGCTPAGQPWVTSYSPASPLPDPRGGLQRPQALHTGTEALMPTDVHPSSQPSTVTSTTPTHWWVRMNTSMLRSPTARGTTSPVSALAAWEASRTPTQKV